MALGGDIDMNLTNLQTIVDQVAASDSYKDTELNIIVDPAQGEHFLLSNEDPPDYYDPDIKINVANATIDIKNGIEL
jgi:hypothetical protein